MNYIQVCWVSCATAKDIIFWVEDERLWLGIGVDLLSLQRLGLQRDYNVKVKIIQNL